MNFLFRPFADDCHEHEFGNLSGGGEEHEEASFDRLHGSPFKGRTFSGKLIEFD
jgi:hypothetical protein